MFKSNKNQVTELDLLQAAKTLQCEKNTPRLNIKLEEYYPLLATNKNEFEKIFETEETAPSSPEGKSNESKLLKVVKAISKEPQFTDEDESYLERVIKLLKDGGVPKKTIQRILNKITTELNPHKILAVLKFHLTSELFNQPVGSTSANLDGPKEIILSEILTGGDTA